MSWLCGLLLAVALGICKGYVACLDLCEQRGQFGAVKLPPKRGGTVVGQCFVEGEPEPDRFQIGAVIGCQHLPWDNREGAFALIEPTGVDRGMDQNDTGIDLTQALLRGGTAMRRAGVQAPA